MENENNLRETDKKEKAQDIIRVEVTFRGNKRMLYDAHKGADFAVGDNVVAEIDKGSDIGRITLLGPLAGLKKGEPHQHNIVRKANEEDLAKFGKILNDERDAFFVCQDKIKSHKLDMTLTEVEKQFDESKILFYFLAEHRVDFRELVKDLASHFRTRIELRQIGVRDEAKRYDGVGVCGRRLCCAGFLVSFDQISTQMARVQHLSLNQSKLSGNCGRLKCCLKYELPLYEELNSCLPQPGQKIKTAKGEGKVIGVNTLKGQVRVLHPDSPLEEIIEPENCQKLLFPERGDTPPEEEAPLKFPFPMMPPQEEALSDDESLEPFTEFESTEPEVPEADHDAPTETH